MTLLLSRIILTFALLYGGYIIWTKNVDLILWSKNKVESTLPVNKENKSFIIKKFNKPEAPLSPDSFVDVINELASYDLFRENKIEIEVSLGKKDGSIVSGIYTGGHGRSAKEGYRYDLLTKIGSSQTVKIIEVDSVLKFNIIEIKP